MAHIKDIFFYQRLLYKRVLLADRGKKAEKVFVAWLFLVVCIRFLANTGFAVTTLINGNFSVGIPLLEFNLFHLLLLWILIPPVITGILGPKGFLASLSTFFPLSKKEIFFSVLYGILFQPVFWIMGLISLFGLVPVFFLTSGVFLWLCIGIVFLCFCITLSIFLSYLLIIVSSRFKLSGIFSPLFKIALCILLFANFYFYWGADIVVIVFNKSFILYSPEGGRSILSVLTCLRPSTYLGSPLSPPECHIFLLPFMVMAVFLFFSVLWIYFSFLISQGLILPPTGNRRKRFFHFLSVPGAIKKRKCTSLLSKEIISLLSTIEVKSSICITLFFGIYLIQAPGMNQVLFIFVIAVMTILLSPFFFNSFGPDGIAVGRYHLLPVSPVSLFKAKNRAIRIVLSLELFPLIVLNLIRSLEVLLVVYNSLIIVSIILVYCCVGNITSVILARPRRYSHFGDNKEGGAGRIFLAIVFWGVPLYVNDMVKGDPITGVCVYACVSLFLLVLYFILLGKMSVLFNERKEEMYRNLL